MAPFTRQSDGDARVAARGRGSCHPRPPPGKPCRTCLREAPSRIRTFRAPVGVAACAVLALAGGAALLRPTARVELARPHHPGHRRARAGDPSRPLARREVRGLRGGTERTAPDLRPPARRRPHHRGGREHAGRPALAPLVPGRFPAQLRGGAGDLRGPRPRRPARLLVAPPEQSPGVNGEGAISDEGPGYLAWSPDGRRIAYAVGRRDRGPAAEGGPPTTIARWSSRTRSPGRRTARASLTCSGTRPSSTRPTPSATSRRAPSGPSPRPAARRSRSRTRRRSTPVPAWLPDGRGLLFVSSRDGSRDVYRVAIDRSGTAAGAPVRLTTGLAIHTIDLSRDGRQLAYADFTEYANVATLPIPSAGPASTYSGGRR